MYTSMYVCMYVHCIMFARPPSAGNAWSFNLVQNKLNAVFNANAQAETTKSELVKLISTRVTRASVFAHQKCSTNTSEIYVLSAED